MSKLSPALKAPIDAPFARSGTLPAPCHIASVYERIERHAESKRVDKPTWIAMATGATITMNSPESLTALHKLATSHAGNASAVQTAELIREVGLKCIGFNGVSRTINCLGAFRSSLSEKVGLQLTTDSSRIPTSSNIESSKQRGRALWDSIYRPFESKLIDKLAHSHPDLPVHIVNSEYGLLLADPIRKPASGQRVGRIATSIVAVACLRAQTGVGPQVTSHLFGLRKALEDGSWEDDVQNEVGAKWLSSDEGGLWILESFDNIVEAIGGGAGSSFAPARAKL